jgi:hypothetical protein
MPVLFNKNLPAIVPGCVSHIFPRPPIWEERSADILVRSCAFADPKRTRMSALQKNMSCALCQGAHLDTAAGDFSLSPLRSGERGGERGTNTVANDGWGGFPP